MKKFLSMFKYIVVAICCVFACGVYSPQTVKADNDLTSYIWLSNDSVPDKKLQLSISGYHYGYWVQLEPYHTNGQPYDNWSNRVLCFVGVVNDNAPDGFTVRFHDEWLSSPDILSSDIDLHQYSYDKYGYRTFIMYGKSLGKWYTNSGVTVKLTTDNFNDVAYDFLNGFYDVIAHHEGGSQGTINGIEYETDFDFGESSKPDFTKSETDLNGDNGTNDLHSLGHLENVKLTKFNVTDVVPLIMDKTYYSITYNFFTSTGFDLSKDVKNNTVQYCVTMQVYDSNNKLLRSGSSDYYLALDSHFGEPDCPDNLFWKIYINKESSLITGLLEKLQTSIGVNADNFNKRGYKYVYQFNLRPYCVSDEGVTYGQWTVLKNIYTDNFDDLHYTVDSGDNSYDQTTVNDDGSLSNKENSTDKNSHVGSGSDAHDAQQNADSDTTHDSIIDKGQDWINDNIINGDYNIHIGGEDGSDVSLKGGVSAFTESIYAFANLVNSCFSWAPSWVKNFFALSIAIFCIMILKRAIF